MPGHPDPEISGGRGGGVVLSLFVLTLVTLYNRKAVALCSKLEMDVRRIIIISIIIDNNNNNNCCCLLQSVTSFITKCDSFFFIKEVRHNISGGGGGTGEPPAPPLDPALFCVTCQLPFSHWRRIIRLRWVILQ